MKVRLIFKISFLPVLLFIFGIISCKKTVPASKIDRETYIKIFPEPLNQSSTYIEHTSDGGFLIVGDEDDGQTLGLLKVNEYGEKQWKKTIPGVDLSNPYFTPLADGTLLLTNGNYNGHFCKIEQDGTVQFMTTYAGQPNNSQPIPTNNGGYVIASGTGNNNTTYSTIFNFIPDGSFSNHFNIQDASFAPGMKILYLGIYKCDTFGSYYFFGLCYPNWNGNPRNVKGKIFIAKQTYSGAVCTQNKFVLIDSSDNVHDGYNFTARKTSDDQVIIRATFVDYNNIASCKVIKADDNLKILWETDLNVSVFGSIITDLTECPDGGFLATGWCGTLVKTNYQPFACKVAKDGKILWSKIYSTALTGLLTYGIQLNDGNCFFTGITNGFGRGADRDDVFMMKTDKDGNLK